MDAFSFCLHAKTTVTAKNRQGNFLLNSRMTEPPMQIRIKFKSSNSGKFLSGFSYLVGSSSSADGHHVKSLSPTVDPRLLQEEFSPSLHPTLGYADNVLQYLHLGNVSVFSYPKAAHRTAAANSVPGDGHASALVLSALGLPPTRKRKAILQGGPEARGCSLMSPACSHKGDRAAVQSVRLLAIHFVPVVLIAHRGTRCEG